VFGIAVVTGVVVAGCGGQTSANSPSRFYDERATARCLRLRPEYVSRVANLRNNRMSMFLGERGHVIYLGFEGPPQANDGRVDLHFFVSLAAAHALHTTEAKAARVVDEEPASLVRQERNVVLESVVPGAERGWQMIAGCMRTA
jgi:hypothetical protein